MNGKLENYELFDKMIGDKYEECIGIGYLNSRLKQLVIYKRDLVRRLKSIKRKRCYTNYTPSDDYISDMGWEYLMIGSGTNPVSDFELDRVISAFNDDYYKSTLRSIEIKLAFLNKNIKKLKRLVREKMYHGSDLSRLYKFNLDIEVSPCNMDESIRNLYKYIKCNRMDPFPVYIRCKGKLLHCGEVKSLYNENNTCIFTVYFKYGYPNAFTTKEFNYTAKLYTPTMYTNHNNELVIKSALGIILTEETSNE